MNDQQLVLIDKSNPKIAILTLNRKEKCNALNLHLLKFLALAIEEINLDPQKKALIIKGEGLSFCSGLDLKEAADITTAEESNKLLARVLTAIYKSPLVTIAAVHGSAIAGGAGIMSACDFVIAAEKTLFGYPEVKRGLVAAQVMVLLKKQLMMRHIRELLLLGELIDANYALSIGLINKIVNSENLLQEAMEIAKITLKCNSKAISKTKELLDDLTGNFTKDLSKMMIEGLKMRGTKEAQEGMSAFLEHRDPNF